jgi:hypothetical protein
MTRRHLIPIISSPFSSPLFLFCLSCFVNSANSPDEVVKLVSIGIDLLDTQWTQQAADVGIALEFQFPARGNEEQRADIEHDLYDSRFGLDFNPLPNALRGAFQNPQRIEPRFTRALYTSRSSRPAESTSTFVHFCLDTTGVGFVNF